MNIEPGSCILIEGMPYPIASKLILNRTGEQLDHVAICLEAPDNVLSIYEAYLPVARRLSVPAYYQQLRDWAAAKPRWRNRKDRRLRCWVWQPPHGVSGPALTKMEDEAEKLLGTTYRMVLLYGAAWLFNLDMSERWLHCSAFVGKLLAVGGIVPSWNKMLGMVTPVDIRDALLKLGWKRREWPIARNPDGPSLAARIRAWSANEEP